MRNAVYDTEIAGFHIQLIQDGQNSFTVIYGAERHTGLRYSDAGKQLGLSIMHASVCNGKIFDLLPVDFGMVEAD